MFRNSQNIVSHCLGDEVKDNLNTFFSLNPLRWLLRTNCDGVSTFKVDNTSNAVIDLTMLSLRLKNKREARNLLPRFSLSTNSYRLTPILIDSSHFDCVCHFCLTTFYLSFLSHKVQLNLLKNYQFELKCLNHFIRLICEI